MIVRRASFYYGPKTIGFIPGAVDTNADIALAPVAIRETAIPPFTRLDRNDHDK